MKVLRIRHAKLIALIIVLINLLLIYYAWKSTLWKRIALTFDANAFDMDNLNSLQMSSASANGGGGGGSYGKSSKDKLKNANRHIRKSITIVFRTFYPFENDLKPSIDNILEIVPHMQILILQDGVPYPPVTYERNVTADEGQTVRFVNLAFDVEKTPQELHPVTLIRTKYVLFMPDSVRLSNKNLLQKILREINTNAPQISKNINNNYNNNHNHDHNNNYYYNKNTNVINDEQQQQQQQQQSATIGQNEVVRRMIIVPFSGTMKSFSNCLQINLDLPHWTIQYIASNLTEKCDLYLQKHALLTDVGLLKEMPDPFAAPFPEMLYVQAKLAKIPKTIFPQAFQNGRTLFASYHTKQRRLEIRRREFKKMYKELQIKRIVRRAHKVNSKTDSKDTNSPQHNLVLDTQFSSSNFSLPLVTEIDLIGCERMTKSCIGTVYNNRPFYTYLGRHTPPCCLDKLKSTFNHVLEEFENVGIRYWLDNHSLKTAIETNQLSPDAYDIDISFNVDDLERSNALKKSQTKPFVDNDGFYWIKATDGHYFRVQFSKMNQVGVNLLPFEINGNSVRPSGFFGWKAKDFSADYLHPMSTVLFLGKKIMCPNNVREFLEFKNIN